MTSRKYTLIDHFIIELDRVLATASSGKRTAEQRPTPAAGISETPLTEAERRHSEGLMRVNHAGEVSAQALYQGQALATSNSQVHMTMQVSAREEVDHLAWCAQRVSELGGHTSFLNPLWYMGSFTLGMLAGLAGDKWSLGFVGETERQVVRHLQGHLQELPLNDLKSRAIVKQMMEDEAHHEVIAMKAGGVELPSLIRNLMKACSRVMTGTAYWI